MSWFRQGPKKITGMGSKVKMVGNQSNAVNCIHDPETCFEVFKCHWKQTAAVIDKMTIGSGSGKLQASGDDVEAVLHYMDQMMLLLVEESGVDGCQGPILQYMLTENILERLNSWCYASGELHERLKLEQLKIYELLISQSRQQVLVHKPIIRPLLHLLSRCAEHNNAAVKDHMILVLHQLCVCLTQNAQLLELFFSAGANHGPAKFLVFSLLIPYVHHEGHVGQQARDALLLIMALSSKNEGIGRYIAENSDFCPVLATGLSGLYSSLPRKLEIPTDDWCQLTRDDWCQIPELVMFLNSLGFCNAVVQVAHPLVRDQLLKFIYSGFLVPVLGPALHQDFDIDLQLYGQVTQNSLEEVIAATAYLDLFIRQITEPTLMQTFLKFILMEKYDEIIILDSLITRINSNSRVWTDQKTYLCMVSLALFKTLIDLNCEEVMFQLVFKYLIPCTHVMVSQKRSLKEIDLYSKSAEKFLSLTPACCVPEWSDSPQGTNPPGTPDQASRTSSQASSPEHGNRTAFPPGSFGSKLEHYETNYMEYLKDSRQRISLCAKACQCWSALYNGENPSPDSVWQTSLSMEKMKLVDSVFLNAHEGCSGVRTTKKKNGEEFSARQTSDSGSESLKIQSHGQNAGDSRKSSVDLSARTLSEEICLESPLENDGPPSVLPGATLVKAEVNRLPEEKKELTVSKDVERRSSVSTPDDGDITGFVHTLKRVKTPENVCDSLEDSFSELDALIEDLKLSDYVDARKDTQTDGVDTLPNFVRTGPIGDAVKPKTVMYADDKSCNRTRTSSAVSAKSDVSDNLCEFDTNASAHETLQTIPQQPSSTSREPSPEQSASTAPASINIPAIPKSLVPFMQDRPHSLGSPNIGPFLTVILHKLDSLMQNTLYVNLLLTGLITRLACYPQPLLRSFLLNHNLVFQPTIKSLIQVLSSVKHKIDCFSYTVDNFENLLLRARRFLAWREDSLNEDYCERTKARSESIASTTSLKSKASSLTQEAKSDKRKPSLTDILFRRSPQTDKDKSTQGGKSRLERVAGGGYRYVNARTTVPVDRKSEVETQKTKNAVYSAIVLEELLKELAAISQEHTVLQVDDGYASN